MFTPTNLHSSPARPQPALTPLPSADALPLDDAGEAPSLHAAVSEVQRAVSDLLALVVDSRVRTTELGALLGLVAALDTGHAAAVELTDRVDADDLAARGTGLSLEGLLALSSRMTFGDRRTLTNSAVVLRDLPFVRQAFCAGAIGWAEVRAIVAEVRGLDAAARQQFDAGFADLDRFQRMDADQVLDAVRDAVGRLKPDTAKDTATRAIEHRFLHVQPALDNALTGYFELDAEAGATFLAGLEAVMPPPSAGPRDVTRDAVGEADPDEGVDQDVDQDLDAPQAATADADPSFTDPVERRSRARQRADALVRLAELPLAGSTTGGGPRRARPRVEVVMDVRTLVGDDATARSARLLWATTGPPPILTAAAARRLAEDAHLRFLLTDGGEVLGVTAPTPAIPAAVRAAVRARDQGCRFPGCSVPIHWTDLHHVIARVHGGPTTVDNLVALCRRHHVAVTDGRWQLSMDADAVVTARRGRRRATSDPPARRDLLAAAHAAPPGRVEPDTPGSVP